MHKIEVNKDFIVVIVVIHNAKFHPVESEGIFKNVSKPTAKLKLCRKKTDAY